MIAEFHAKALAEIAGVKLVAAYNRSPAKGRTLFPYTTLSDHRKSVV